MTDSRAGVALWLTGMALMILGFVWILIFYLTQSSFPLQALGVYNIVIGLAVFIPGAVLLIAGLIVATRAKHQQVRS